MAKINVSIKKLREDAVIPKYAKSGDAGMDLTAVDVVYRNDIDCYEFHTGIAIEIPQGYVGLVFPRSSNRKTDAYLCNHVGVIDSGYRGEILVCFKNRDNNGVVYPYDIGDRIAQLMILPYPEIEFNVVDELSETERADGGFGHTGKK